MRTLFLLLFPVICGAQTVFPTKANYVPGGNSGELQYNESGTFGGISNVETNGTNLRLVEQSSVTTATSGNVNIFASGSAPAAINFDVYGQKPTGAQTSFASVYRSEVLCTGLGLSIFGVSTTAVTNSTTYSTPATGTAMSMLPKVKYTTGTGTMAKAYLLTTPSQLYIGSTNYGGFSAEVSAGSDTDPANQAVIIGLLGGSVPTTTTASTTITDFVGVGYSPGESNYSLIYNDATGATTKTDLGSNFPTSIAGAAWLRIWIVAPPGGGVVRYKINNLSNNAEASGSINTNIPAASTALFPIAWVYNGLSLQNSAISVERIYTESNF